VVVVEQAAETGAADYRGARHRAATGLGLDELAIEALVGALGVVVGHYSVSTRRTWRS
jgi:hypothetical protein